MVITATKFRKFRRFVACIADLYIYIYIIYTCMYVCMYVFIYLFIYIYIYNIYLLAYLMYNYSTSPGFSLITQNQSSYIMVETN